jgi:hypothetical protein
MLAMQYRFPFPSDYDMEIIKKRIRERGYLLDGFRHLEWKAYLWSEKNPSDRASINAYAPFYLWQDNAGINNFLGSRGFESLCEDFGRPQIDIWQVWAYLGASNMHSARCMYRQILPITAGLTWEELRQQESARAEELMNQGALSVVMAYDPQQWRLLRITAWASGQEAMEGEQWERYLIGYVTRSHPDPSSPPLVHC